MRRWQPGFLLLMMVLCIGGPACVKGPKVFDTVDTSRAIELDTLNFKRLALDPERVTMVDFYSPGCTFCLTNMWIPDTMAVLFGDRALIGKVNITLYDTLWKQYQINSLPTFVFFRDGVEAARRPLWQIASNVAALDSLSFIMTELLAGRTVTSPVGTDGPGR